jgi:hypothetical protein
MYKTDLLILYSKMIVDFTEIHTKHINSLRARNAKFLNNKLCCILGFKFLKNYSTILWAELL